MRIEPGTKFGQLEVIEEIAMEYYRCRCHRCRYDGALATLDALFTPKVTQCFDCAELARMTHGQRAVAAFKKKLALAPMPDETEIAPQRVVTVGEVLAA